jgi:hypothetical protein
MRRFNWTEPDRLDFIPGWLAMAAMLAACVPVLADGVVSAVQVLVAAAR